MTMGRGERRRSERVCSGRHKDQRLRCRKSWHYRGASGSLLGPGICCNQRNERKTGNSI